MIIKLNKIIAILALGVSIASCTNDLPSTDLTSEALIPKPLSITATNSSFVLNNNTVIQTDSEESFVAVGEFLSEKIDDRTTLNLSLSSSTNGKNGVYINKVISYQSSNLESYELRISKDSIVVNAINEAGAFRAIQTIRQLIPFESITAEKQEFIIPTGVIIDEPNYTYRGAMLDVSRHFFTVDDVKKYIDGLAYYKINTLHLHLSDDQGWRLEIKSWPELANIGGLTEVGGEDGGFYTQEDYTEIINYAAKHHIIVIPEIDMPGHTHAASTAYPFLNGAKDYIKVLDQSNPDRRSLLYTGMDVGFSTFDTRKEEVYDFIDDVIREIAAITPGPYIHLGGDESLVTEKDDYIYFVTRVSKIINKYGKTMVGWDEVVTADIPDNSIVQFWAEEENAKQAKEKGLKIIMSPAKKAYLDMKYDTLSKHGLHWAAYIPVKDSYEWTPEKYTEGITKSDIIGVEAPLWSETISNTEELEYLAYPRVIGIAEVGWSTEENRDWEDYKERLSKQTPYLNKMNIKYYPSEQVDWK